MQDAHRPEGHVVSDAQRAVLDKSAIEIATTTTRPEEIVHHYLSGEDLKDLEHASKAEVGPWLQLSLGAAIGNAVPTILGIRSILAQLGAPTERMDLTPLIPIGFEFLFLGASIAFGIVTWRTRGQSVGDICRKIRARPKQNGAPETLPPGA